MSYLANFYSQITGPKHDLEGRSSPKLVFLHGVMGFAANWRRIAKAFEQDFEVLTFDQRGHGRSFQPSHGYRPEDYAEDLEKILDELGWGEIHLVGHSMGGRTSLHFASRYPGRVTRLVIEDIGPAMYPAGANTVTQLIDSVPVPFPSKREAKQWFDTTFMQLFSHSTHKESLAAYLYANLTEDASGQAVWRFYAPGIRESIAAGREKERWEEVRALQMPTLVVRGERSNDLPREVFERMLKENPKMTGAEIPAAGHWVHSDQPDLFIQVLKRFFNGEAVGKT